MTIFARHHTKTVLWVFDVMEMVNNFFFALLWSDSIREKFYTLTSVSFRNDGSIFDGLVEEDDKDKAKR